MRAENCQLLHRLEAGSKLIELSARAIELVSCGIEIISHVPEMLLLLLLPLLLQLIAQGGHVGSVGSKLLCQPAEASFTTVCGMGPV